MSKVNHITEIIPDFDKLPDWAREAFKDGQYFTVVSEKVIEYEAKLEAAESLLKCRTNDLERLQTGYDICDAKLTQFQDLYRYSQATIKDIAEWVKAERDCCPAVNDAISDTRCQPYTNRGLRCPDCPATNVNELQAIIKGNNDGRS